jgi:hypothetical protein
MQNKVINILGTVILIAVIVTIAYQFIFLSNGQYIGNLVIR